MALKGAVTSQNFITFDFETVTSPTTGDQTITVITIAIINNGKMISMSWDVKSYMALNITFEQAQKTI